MSLFNAGKIHTFVADTMFKHGYEIVQGRSSEPHSVYKKGDDELIICLGQSSNVYMSEERLLFYVQANGLNLEVNVCLHEEEQLLSLAKHMTRLATNILNEDFLGKKVLIRICEEIEQEFNLTVEGIKQLHFNLAGEADEQLSTMADRIDICTKYLSTKYRVTADDRVQFKRYMDYVKLSVAKLSPIKDYLTDSQKIQLETYENIVNSIDLKNYVY